jgi:hypothetical protein
MDAKLAQEHAGNLSRLQNANKEIVHVGTGPNLMSGANQELENAEQRYYVITTPKTMDFALHRGDDEQ